MCRITSHTNALILVIALSVPGCQDLGTDPPIALAEDTISEAVFRYMFMNNESGQQQGAKVYFIGRFIPGDSTRQGHYIDMSDEFMARFKGNPRPVKKISQCTISMNGVFDKQTGDRGLLFRVESISGLALDQAEVLGGYFEAGLSASGNRYIVKRIDHKWVVVKDYLIWIS